MMNLMKKIGFAVEYAERGYATLVLKQDKKINQI